MRDRRLKWIVERGGWCETANVSKVCPPPTPTLPVFTRITTFFHYTNHIRAEQLPLLCLLCMHDDLFVTEEKGNESTNLENMMMKMVVNDYADGSCFLFFFFLGWILLAPLCNHDL